MVLRYKIENEKNNSIPQVILDVITYTCCDWNLSILAKDFQCGKHHGQVKTLMSEYKAFHVADDIFERVFLIERI